MREFGRRPGSDGLDEVPSADPAGARWLRRLVAGSVAAITTPVEGGYRGATASAFIPASIDPFLLLISLEAEGQMSGWIESSGVFALNLLAWSEQLLADRFAGFAPLASSSFSDVDHRVGETGSPILIASIAWADCRLVSSFDTGDHRHYVGRAIAVGSGGGDAEEPLLYFRNRYRRLR